MGTNPFALLVGWLLDFIFGDPQRLPHPIVWFGKMIAAGEHRLNKGNARKAKGAILAIGLILMVFGLAWAIRYVLGIFALFIFDGTNQTIHQIPIFLYIFDVIVVFFCLAGTTLIKEVREVFLALDRSLEEGRVQVGRIVGRDTSELSAQEVRTAALETLAENLSDGVIAPLFWLALLGTPGMLAYKMVNTLDSMIGYKTERYKDFGCWAAHIDDIANYIPARLTAILMVLASGRLGLLQFVWKNGRNHASPNSGYPEAALAGILNCRFGGPHYYFGELFDKPYIGENERVLTTGDMKKAVRVNRTAEIIMFAIVLAVSLWGAFCWLQDIHQLTQRGDFIVYRLCGRIFRITIEISHTKTCPLGSKYIRLEVITNHKSRLFLCARFFEGVIEILWGGLVIASIFAEDNRIEVFVETTCSKFLILNLMESVTAHVQTITSITKVIHQFFCAFNESWLTTAEIKETVACLKTVSLICTKTLTKAERPSETLHNEVVASYLSL